MQLGYLTHVAGHGSPAAIYRDTVALAVAAEELGLDAFWVAQHHHGSLEGLLPSPLVLLAAIAERTSVIRLGTAVIAAPLEDPLRLAEDAAVRPRPPSCRLHRGRRPGVRRAHRPRTRPAPGGLAGPAVVGDRLPGRAPGGRAGGHRGDLRSVHAGEDPQAVLDRFRDDPMLPLADAVIGYTQPARAPLSTHVATLRLLAAQVRPALRERAAAPA